MDKGRRRLLPLFLIVFLLHHFVLAQSTPDFSLGKQMFQDGKYQEAKDVFTAIFTADNSNDSTAFYLGRICLNQGDLDESIQWYEKAIAINESSSEYYHQMGLAYGLKAQSAGLLKKAGLAKNMKKHVEKAVELDPANIEARFSLINFYLQAPGFMGGGKDKARLQAEEIKKVDVQNGHIAFASVYESEKKYDAAENEFRTLIQLDSTNAEHQFRLGYFFINIKRYEDAVLLFEGIIAKNPDEMNAYYQIGKVGAISGKNLDKAKANMMKYLEHEPNSSEPSLAWANYRLGMIYEKWGKMDEAKEAYQTVLALDPKMKLAEDALKKIK